MSSANSQRSARSHPPLKPPAYCDRIGDIPCPARGDLDAAPPTALKPGGSCCRRLRRCPDWPGAATRPLAARLPLWCLQRPLATSGHLASTPRIESAVERSRAACALSAHCTSERRSKPTPASEICVSPERRGKCWWRLPCIHENALLRVGRLDNERADDGSRPASGEKHVAAEAAPHTCIRARAGIPRQRRQDGRLCPGAEVSIAARTVPETAPCSWKQHCPRTAPDRRN